MKLIQVAAISRQFAILHNALKFDALRLLSVIFSSQYSVSIMIFCLNFYVISG